MDLEVGMARELNAASMNQIHCDLKVSSSQEKIDENFASYFFKTKLTISALHC